MCNKYKTQLIGNEATAFLLNKLLLIWCIKFTSSDIPRLIQPGMYKKWIHNSLIPTFRNFRWLLLCMWTRSLHSIITTTKNIIFLDNELWMRCLIRLDQGLPLIKELWNWSSIELVEADLLYVFWLVKIVMKIALYFESYKNKI